MLPLYTRDNGFKIYFEGEILTLSLNWRVLISMSAEQYMFCGPVIVLLHGMIHTPEVSSIKVNALKHPES